MIHFPEGHSVSQLNAKIENHITLLTKSVDADDVILTDVVPYRSRATSANACASVDNPRIDLCRFPRRLGTNLEHHSDLNHSISGETVG